MKQPMRIFEGSAQPHEPFWTLRNAADGESGEPEIEFYGYISEYSWYEDDITPKMFKDDLYGLGKGGPVTVRINSGGGEMIAASVIRSILVDYPGKVTMRIDGLCASAATYVAMAGDVVKMQDSAYFMIHDPWTIAIGNVEEMKLVVEFLKTLKDGILDTYASKTSLPREKISKMMTDTTWMTASEAKNYGFVDEVIGGKSAKGSGKMDGTQGLRNAAILNALENYTNVPDALRARFGQAGADPVVEPSGAAAGVPEPTPEVKKFRAEAKLLGMR